MFLDVKKWLIKHRWLAIVLQLIIVLIVYMGFRAWQLRDAISGPAPNIQGYLLDARNIELKQYSGEPVLVYFWASWCPLCKMTNGSIDSIAKDYKVITVASWSDNAALIEKFVEEAGLTMPVIVDNEGEWAGRYGVKGVPTSFIIDDKGEIQFIESGYTTEFGLRMRLWLLSD